MPALLMDHSEFDGSATNQARKASTGPGPNDRAHSQFPICYSHDGFHLPDRPPLSIALQHLQGGRI